MQQTIDKVPLRKSLPQHTEMLTIKETARRLCLHEDTVRRYVRRKLLIAHRIGRRVRLDWLETLERIRSGQLGDELCGTPQAAAWRAMVEPRLRRAVARHTPVHTADSESN